MHKDNASDQVNKASVFAKEIHREEEKKKAPLWMMEMKNSRHLLKFVFALIVLASCASPASAVKNRGVEYRRSRSSNLNHKHGEAPWIIDDKNSRKIAAVATESDKPRKSIRRSRRTRGSNTKHQSRRELGKSNSGKSSSGKSGSGKSNSSGSGGSGGSSGSSSSNRSSGAGWSAVDGSYCGCMCMSNYATFGINTHGLSCDYTVDQNSYGYGLRSTNNGNGQQEKYGEFQSFFEWSAWSNWQSVEEDNEYFTNYGYEKQARNGADDTYIEYEGDDAGNGEDDHNDEEDDVEDEGIVVSEMDSGYDPYMAFDVGNCETYAHLWTYDLLVSCADGDQHCKCTFTEELMRMGLLSCSDEASCPDECGVCSNCIKSVCGQFVPSKLVTAEIKNNSTIILLVIFSMVLLLLTTFAVIRRRKNKKGILNESLMDTGDKNWMVPVNEADGLPAEKGGKSKPVWLAPDVSTVPQVPLFPDLLKDVSEQDAITSPDSDTMPKENEIKTREHQQAVELSPVGTDGCDSPKRQHPGPWLVPSSNCSIPSSISNSTDSGKSIGTLEGEI
ncbi:unnamed protein product [Pseudo-nitzschia multistriata]|uniref:Uncharacterized protein n=1 Tax=Pseudo-nitzschia multistriata TaxID=183589 RepID=A0A448YU58_9STRA|nr:unnamed protein product [Pseudo-nitzschia multistriata]